MFKVFLSLNYFKVKKSIYLHALCFGEYIKLERRRLFPPQIIQLNWEHAFLALGIVGGGLCGFYVFPLILNFWACSGEICNAIYKDEK